MGHFLDCLWALAVGLALGWLYWSLRAQVSGLEERVTALEQELAERGMLGP